MRKRIILKWNQFISSFSIFQIFKLLVCGSSSVGRATAFQAVGRGFEPRLPLLPAGASAKATLSRRSLGEGGSYFCLGYDAEQCRCSSVVEHFLGKEEVKSSILFNGSKRAKEVR